MNDGYPVLTGDGKVLLSRRVPHGAYDHKAKSDALQADVAAVKAQMFDYGAAFDAVADLPEAAETDTPAVTASRWNRFLGIFRRKKSGQ